MKEDERSDDRYTFRYSSDDPFEPAATVCRAVGWAIGVDETELEPLARIVDPEALNGQFSAGGRRGDGPRSSRSDRSGAPTITFEYEGCLVTVEADRVAVCEPSALSV